MLILLGIAPSAHDNCGSGARVEEFCGTRRALPSSTTQENKGVCLNLTRIERQNLLRKEKDCHNEENQQRESPEECPPKPTFSKSHAWAG